MKFAADDAAIETLDPAGASSRPSAVAAVLFSVPCAKSDWDTSRRIAKLATTPLALKYFFAWYAATIPAYSPLN